MPRPRVENAPHRAPSERTSPHAAPTMSRLGGMSFCDSEARAPATGSAGEQRVVAVDSRQACADAGTPATPGPQTGASSGSGD
jgi:hypothetical protein